MATNVAQAFEEFRSRLELSPSLQQAVTTHHRAVREWIEAIDPKIETRLVGSLQRKTRIQPRAEDTFDIDILVILGSFYSWVPSGGVTPGAALDTVEEIVSGNEVYDRMGPETDSPTIVIEYADGSKVELIPAYRDQIGFWPGGTPVPPVGRGYWIPKNNRWVTADYDYDAEYLSALNEQTGKWLVPVVKMLKAAKRNRFSAMRSYHLEVMVAGVLSGLFAELRAAGLPLDSPHVIWGSFVAASSMVNGVQIPGSKSGDASGYLAPGTRTAVGDMLRSLSGYSRALLTAGGPREAIEGWRAIFGEPFPSYG